MARFVAGTPQITREPTITVDAGLPVGRHRFRLEVVDGAGLRSAPDHIIVEVQRITVGPTIPTGPLIPSPGPVVGPVIGPVIPTPVPIIPTPIIRQPRSRTRRKKEKP